MKRLQKGCPILGQRYHKSRQRELIFQVLCDAGGAMTAEEICSKARDHYPRLGLATVYRNLRVLQEEEIVSSLNLGDGTTRFEIRDRQQHHQHFICDSCHRSFCLPGCLLESAAQHVAQHLPERFLLTRHELTLYGLCGDCRDKKEVNVEVSADNG